MDLLKAESFFRFFVQFFREESKNGNVFAKLVENIV